MEIEISHTKIRTIRNVKSITKSVKKILLYIIEDASLEFLFRPLKHDFSAPPGPAFCLIRWRGFRNTHFRLYVYRLEDYADMGVESFRYAA